MPGSMSTLVAKPGGRLLSVAVAMIIILGSWAPETLASQAGRGSPPSVPPAGPIETVGDFLSLGANTVREIQEAIELAGDEADALLEELHEELSSFLAELEQAYKDTLQTTINSLDDFTHRKLLELQSLIDRVNAELQADIMLASAEAQNVIREATFQARLLTAELEASFKRVLIVGGETAAYVVSRAVYDLVLIVSLVFLGIGVLVFFAVLYLRRLPTGIARPIVGALGLGYVLVFGTLAFIPPVRVNALVFVGAGLEQQLEVGDPVARIFRVVPDSIVIGETEEIEIWGTALRPGGVDPEIMLGGFVLPVSAASDSRVVARVVDVQLVVGSAAIIVRSGADEAAREVVRVVEAAHPPEPPDLVVAAATLIPASPVVGGNAQLVVTVRNDGGPADNVLLEWRMTAAATGDAKSQLLAFEPGESKMVSFNGSYLDEGQFESLVIVDPLNSIEEKDENNNQRQLAVTVKPRPPREARVTVRFVSVTVHDAREPVNDGEMRLNGNVNGREFKWPRDGSKSVRPGGTYDVGVTFRLTMTEGETLAIYVNGVERDNPGFPLYDDHDAMGEVSSDYGSTTNWGAGSHDERSGGHRDYTIHYVIEVEWNS